MAMHSKASPTELEAENLLFDVSSLSNEADVEANFAEPLITNFLSYPPYQKKKVAG